MTAIAEAPAPVRGIFGQPKGLYYLAATEAWERFSYYGMTALVVLYMVNQLLLPGHVENIAGFAGFRAALESVFGPMSTQALASQIFGLYSGFVYFTPVLGGWIADRFIGQRNAVVAGAVLMSAGHLAMAFDQSFLVALALLILGSGLLKGNISAQVGALYAVGDETNRVRGYTIFSMGINVGSTLGPIVCGLLAQLYGWHTGFGAAALFILFGLVTYLVGYRHLPSRAARAVSVSRALTAGEWRRIRAICAVLAIVVCHATSYFQSFNTAAVWTQDHVNLDLGGFAIPVPWFNAVDPVFSILGVPVVLALWRWQARVPRRRRTWRSGENRPGRVAGRQRQRDPGGGDPGVWKRRAVADLAVPLFRDDGLVVPVLLARDAGAGLARRARAGERDDDGRGVPDAVRGEQHHGPPRWTL